MITKSSFVCLGAFFFGVLGAPAYELASGHWPGRGVDANFTLAEVRSGKAAREIEAALASGSHLQDLTRTRYDEAAYLLLGRTRPGVVVGKERWLFAEKRLGEPGEKKRERMEIAVRSLGVIVRDLEARGTRVIFELVPRKEALHPEMLPGDLAEPFVPIFDSVRDRMLAEGLVVPDLRPALDSKSALKYLTNDTHWNGAGARAAALVIAQEIRGGLVGRPVPGPKLVTTLRQDPPEAVRGREQRLLGFPEGGVLDARFDDWNVRTVAVRPGRKRVEAGSKKDLPILFIGTSMSGAKFASVSNLIGELGVDVQSSVMAGYGAAYHFAGIYRRILTGERPAPEVLVWEFPADFVIREGAYFSDPLEALAGLLESGDVERQPLVPRARTLSQAWITAESEGAVDLRVTGRPSCVTYLLESPTAGDGGTWFEYGHRMIGKRGSIGMSVVEWGEVNGPQGTPRVLGRRRVEVRRYGLPLPMLVRLTAPRGRSIDFIRIRPLTTGATVRLSNMGLWRSMP